MSFTFSQVSLETLEMYDLNIVIDETGFSQDREGTVSLDWDQKAIEIFHHRDNGTDLLLNPIILDGEWPKIFKELEQLNFEDVEEYFQECRELEKWVRDPKED